MHKFITVLVVLASISSSHASKTLEASSLEEGVIVYDPGLKRTCPFEPTNISFVDGEAGELYYRGKPLKSYLDKSFPEVASVLVGDEFSDTCSDYPEGLMQALWRNEKSVDAMGLLSEAYAMLSNKACVTDFKFVFNVMPTIVANMLRFYEGRKAVHPDPNLSFIDNFFYMWKGSKDKSSRLLNMMLIAHADHGFNLSTTVARGISSGYSKGNKDYFAIVQGAIAALKGDRHGGANRAVAAMLDEIGSVDKVDEFLDSVEAREKLLMGFGHRVYKTQDPRAAIFEGEIQSFLANNLDPKVKLRFDIAQALKQKAAQRDFFKDRNIYPNLDLYSGLLFSAMGIPDNMFTVMFAFGRMAGWLAHIHEENGKIMRPHELPPVRQENND